MAVDRAGASAAAMPFAARGNKAAFATWSNASTAARLSIKTTGVLAVAAIGEAYYLMSTHKPLPDCAGPNFGVERADGAAMSARVLFVGDSLVTGVGAADHGDGEGPILPRVVARAVADSLRAEVTWHAIGVNGADARTLRTVAVPQLMSAQHTTPGLTVVVVLVGLNDWKRALRGRTPDAFRHDLRDLLHAIKDSLGPDADRTVVLLPRLPIHLAPAIRDMWPLNWFASQCVAQWERQKDAVVRELTFEKLRVFVPQDDGRRGGAHGHHAGCDAALTSTGGNVDTATALASRSMWAEDGVHPSVEGYRTWARHMARQAVGHLTALHGADV